MTADAARTAFLVVAARARADEHGHANLTDRDRAFGRDLLARLDRARVGLVALEPAVACTTCGAPLPASEARAGYTTCEHCDAAVGRAVEPVGLHAVPDPDGAR